MKNITGGDKIANWKTDNDVQTQSNTSKKAVEKTNDIDIKKKMLDINKTLNKVMEEYVSIYENKPFKEMYDNIINLELMIKENKLIINNN